MNENFAYWFKRITKWLILLAFFVIAIAAYDKMPGIAAIGGVMTIIVIFYYVLIGLNVGNEKP